MIKLFPELKHLCDESCLCPVHKTDLIYSPHYDLHACQDKTCTHLRKLLSPDMPECFKSLFLLNPFEFYEPRAEDRL